jgi:hypothetical protein
LATPGDFPNVQIVASQFMPLRTVRFESMFSSDAFAAMNVGLPCDRLKVIWIATNAIATKMIERKAVGN